MKRILLVGTNRKMVSGVSTHINQLMDSELASKYIIDNFVVGSNGGTEAKLKKLQRYFFSPFCLASKILAFKPDLVHLNPSMEFKGFFRDAAYLIVAKSLGKKVVIQLHGGLKAELFFNKKSWLFWPRVIILEAADAVILLSKVEFSHASGFCNFKLLKVIPNAIDVGAFENHFLKNMGKADEITLAYIGRLVDSKGIKESIEALAKLKQNGFDNFRLKIAGNGPYENYLKKLSKDLNVSDIVEFLGPIFGEKKKEFWHDADVLVFPSYFEGVPYAILEALAAGAPIITTKVGGIPETMEDGVHGIFVEPKNAEAVADAIKYLISNRDRLNLMSNACIERANKHYSIGRLSKQFDDIYNAICS